MKVNMRSCCVRVALIQYDWCLYKKRTQTHDRASCGDRGKHWSSCQPRNSKDCWPSPEPEKRQGRILLSRLQGEHEVKWSEVKSLSRVRLFATPWTVAYQAPPSMGFSRQECWSGLPFPSPGDLPDPGIEPRSPALKADALLSEPPGKPRFLTSTELQDNIFERSPAHQQKIRLKIYWT